MTGFDVVRSIRVLADPFNAQMIWLHEGVPFEKALRRARLRRQRVAATLNGTLNVIQLAGFAPAVGQSFTFLTFGTESGAFTTVEGTAIGTTEALSLDTSDTNDLRLDVISTAPAVSSAGGVLKTQASTRPTATASKVAVG